MTVGCLTSEIYFFFLVAFFLVAGFFLGAAFFFVAGFFLVAAFFLGAYIVDDNKYASVDMVSKLLQWKQETK